MITTLFALALPARAATVERYDCDQINPVQYADFHLRFTADIDVMPEQPLTAKLFDNETLSMRIASSQLRNMPRFWDLPNLEAWGMGSEPNGTQYILRVPDDGFGATFDVQVVQVFGGGIAQSVHDFTCSPL